MGASLSLALRKYNSPWECTGVVRSKASQEEGTKLNIAKEILLEEEFLNSNSWDDYDLIVFSLPVDLTCDKINLIPDSYKGFITDLGSTKVKIIQAVEQKFGEEHLYYSSHPMAGSEHTGLAYAKEDLYDNRLCILTPPRRVAARAEEFITQFWKSINMNTIVIKADDHDQILAYLSHSPHILSSLLANWAEENSVVRDHNIRSPYPLTGGGFRDMTRIAGSNPEMWDAIINTNKAAIYHSLIDFRDRLNGLIAHLTSEKEPKDGFWKKYFQRSKVSRNKIMKLD